MKASKMVWAGRIMSALAVFPFLAGGVYGLVSNDPKMAEGFAHYGFTPQMLPVIIALELICGLIYAIPLTSVLGAVLLTGYMGGAIVTHLRVGEYVVVLQVLIGVLIWGGLFLREPRLRAIFPLRKG